MMLVLQRVPIKDNGLLSLRLKNLQLNAPSLTSKNEIAMTAAKHMMALYIQVPVFGLTDCNLVLMCNYLVFIFLLVTSDQGGLGYVVFISICFMFLLTKRCPLKVSVFLF